MSITEIIMLVLFGGLLVPILSLFYRQGKKDQAVIEMKRDLNGLGKKVADTRDQHIQALSDLKAQFDNVNATLIRVTESIKYIRLSVEKLEKRKDK